MSSPPQFSHSTAKAAVSAVSDPSVPPAKKQKVKPSHTHRRVNIPLYDYQAITTEKDWNRLKYDRTQVAGATTNERLVKAIKHLQDQIDVRQTKNLPCKDLIAEVNKLKRKLQERYTPHTGAEVLSQFTPYYPDSDTFSTIIDLAEAVSSYAVILSNARDIPSVLAASVLFFKTRFHGSISMKISEMVCDLVKQATPQSGDETDDSTSVPTFLAAFRVAVKNWKRFATFPAFSHVARILNIAIAAGLCQLTSVQYTVETLNAFTGLIVPKQSSCIDFFDALMQGVNYFLEAGYEAFRTKSIRPFFFTDQKAARLEEQYYLVQLAIRQVSTGNLNLVPPFRGSVVTEDSLADIISETVQDYQEMVNNIRKDDNTWHTKVLRDRLAQLRVWQIDLLQCVMGGGLREAPFSVFLFGESGIGKSAVVTNVMQLVLQANGFPSDPQRVVTVNPSDKFWSNFRSDTTGVILDDVGNTMPDFVQEAPTQKFIELNNNMAGYAPKAEANEKGKVAVRPKVICATSNIKGFNAQIYSAKPISICRRGYSVTVHLKPEFAENGRYCREKVLAAFGNETHPYPNIYEFDVEIAEEGRGGVVVYKYVPFMLNCGTTTPLRRVNYVIFIQWLLSASKKHFSDQKLFVENLRMSHQAISFCEKCSIPSSLCKCVTPHYGLELLPWFRTTFQTVFGPRLAYKLDNTCLACMRHITRLRGMSPPQLILAESAKMESSIFSWWRLLIGESIMESERVQLLVADFALDYYFPRSVHIVYSLVHFLILWFFLFGPALCLFPFFVYLVSLYGCIAIERIHHRALSDIRDDAQVVQEAFERQRSPWRFSDYAVGIIAGSAALWQLWRVTKTVASYTSLRTLFHNQSGLNPQNDDERALRDSQVNMWAKPVVKEKIETTCVTTTTHEQLTNIVFKNLCYVRRLDAQGVKFCNALALKGNILLLPYHMLCDEEYRFEFYRAASDVVGSRFSAQLSRSSCARIASTDLALVSIASAGEFKNLISYIDFDVLPFTSFTMIWKDRNGMKKEIFGRSSPAQSVSNGTASFPGGTYDLTEPTFDGLCMGTMVAQTRYPKIAGWHLGGITGTPAGVAGCLKRAEFDTAFCVLMQRTTCLPVADAANLPQKQMGKEYFHGTELHPKAEVRFLEPGTNLEVYGSCDGRAEYHSSVIATPIAKDVAALFGCDKRWGKPRFHRWRPWQASLVHSAIPCDGMSPSVLLKAVTCYKQRLIVDIFSKLSKKSLAALRPLSNIDNVSGIDGIRFIDSIDPNTSMGYPLNKPKREFLLDVEDETHACPRNFPDWIWDEVALCEKTYLQGTRAYPIFKACLKDEPTLVTKDKVRVFQAAPIHLGLLIRKYFLPLVRELSVYPLISECAVGINCQGPEWNELSAHITKFGKDAIIAGDYSKYDLRLPAEVTHACFRILLDIAKYVGYSEDELTIMAGIATDVVYPVVAYNGTLIKHHGGNPSGQNLTVYINSMANSILGRYGFYTIYPECSNNFHRAVALTTYGDDFKGSVHPNFRNYNHVTFKEVLASFGMVLTMPDKTAAPQEFLHDENCDFLKRRSVYIPEIDCMVGALEPESVYKSMMSVIRSQAISLNEQAAINLSGALQEGFFHGRDVYEDWRSKVLRISDNHPYLGPIPGTELTFDNRVQKWIERYRPEQE